MAKNRFGDIGLIPYNYVEDITSVLDDGDLITVTTDTTTTGRSVSNKKSSQHLKRRNTISSRPLLPLNTPQLPSPKPGCESLLLNSVCQLDGPTPFLPYQCFDPNCELAKGQHHDDQCCPPVTCSEYDQQFDVPSAPWFFPNVSREDAEELLKKHNREGSFLIRPSTTENNCYTLSLLSKKWVYAGRTHSFWPQAIHWTQRKWLGLGCLIVNTSIMIGHWSTSDGKGESECTRPSTTFTQHQHPAGMLNAIKMQMLHISVFPPLPQPTGRTLNDLFAVLNNWFKQVPIDWPGAGSSQPVYRHVNFV